MCFRNSTAVDICGRPLHVGGGPQQQQLHASSQEAAEKDTYHPTLHATFLQCTKRVVATSKALATILARPLLLLLLLRTWYASIDAVRDTYYTTPCL